MYIKHLTIKNFRCFSKKDISFDSQITILQGSNGTGKTTILEALHYLCYMRSFRTHTPRDLVRFENDNFFVKAKFSVDSKLDIPEMGINNLDYELQVGFSKGKRVVKLNKKPVSSFAQLIDFYRIITLTEDDLGLIKGGPELRRSFIDNSIFLTDPGFLALLREYKKILGQRNTLIQSANLSTESYYLWTKLLWTKGRVIQIRRKKLLNRYEKTINTALSEIFEKKLSVKFTYKSKNVDLDEDFEDFETKLEELKAKEARFYRSLFGAHLDDFTVEFQSKKSKAYASRGQQKLVVLLLKVAQVMYLREQKGPVVLLLDDFMTDFDEEKVNLLVDFLISCKNQLIFTSPLKLGFFEKKLYSMGAQKLILTH